MIRRALAVALSALAIAGLGITAAAAAWTQTAGGMATARSASMPTGASPSSPVTSATSIPSVTVTWAAVNYSGTATAVAGYVVKRYQAGLAATIAGTCTGTVAALSCTDNLTSSGAYSYSVTPTIGNWIGTEGNKSGTVTYTVPDNAGPVISGTCPTSNVVSTYSKGNTGTWAALCGEKISFTASDATGVGAVQVSVREGSTGNTWLTSQGNFNGSSETKLTVTPSSGVFALNLPGNKLTAGKTYNITVYANDTAMPSNASSTTYSFQIS